MANLTKAAVNVKDVWYSVGTGLNQKNVDAILTLTGQGSSDNLIPASLFGMSKITEVRGARTSDGKFIFGTPDYTGDNLLLTDVSAEVANTPVDITGTVRLVVVGKE